MVTKTIPNKSLKVIFIHGKKLSIKLCPQNEELKLQLDVVYSFRNLYITYINF